MSHQPVNGWCINGWCMCDSTWWALFFLCGNLNFHSHPFLLSPTVVMTFIVIRIVRKLNNVVKKARIDPSVKWVRTPSSPGVQMCRLDPSTPGESWGWNVEESPKSGCHPAESVSYLELSCFEPWHQTSVTALNESVRAMVHALQRGSHSHTSPWSFASNLAFLVLVCHSSDFATAFSTSNHFLILIAWHVRL